MYKNLKYNILFSAIDVMDSFRVLKSIAISETLAMYHKMIGADFLRHHNLLVDIRGQRLIEADTYASTTCSIGYAASSELAMVESSSNQFRKVLTDYPELLQPTFSSATVRHGVQHHLTTSGPPVHARARRLAPDKLAIAKREFAEMEKMGIIRKSNSPWSSPLHISCKTKWWMASLW